MKDKSSTYHSWNCRDFFQQRLGLVTHLTDTLYNITGESTRTAVNRILTADSILNRTAAIAAVMQTTAGGVIGTTCFASRTLVFLGTGQNCEAKEQC